MVDYPPTRWMGVMMREGGLLGPHSPVPLHLYARISTYEWLTYVPVVSGSDIVQWMIKNLDIEDQGKTVRGRFWGRGGGWWKKPHRNSICTSAVSHLCYCVLTLLLTLLCVLDLSAFFRRVHERRNPTALAFLLFWNLLICPSQKCCSCLKHSPDVFSWMLDGVGFAAILFLWCSASDMPEFVDYTRLGPSFVWHLLWVITVSWKIHLVDLMTK